MTLKNWFRALAVLLAFSLCITVFSACGNTGEEETTTPPDFLQPGDGDSAAPQQILRLGYVQSDPVNPFQSASLLNVSLATLLYDSLYRLDDSFAASPLLASGAENSGQTLTVTLRTDVLFTDSTHMNAADVAASFELARKAPSVYAQQLSNFASCKAQGTAVVFQMNQPDPYALNCLNFPIVKAATASAEVPVGSGRYIFSKNGTDASLAANPSWPGGSAMQIGSVTLVNIPDSTVAPHTLEIGNLSFLYDTLSSGSYQRISAGVKNTAMNNLVFLGVNSRSQALSNPQIVQAVNLALDRDKLAETAYQGHAQASSLPFHPAWSAAQSLTQKTAADTAAAIRLLEEAGYTKVNSTGVRTDTANKPITLKLACNKTNAAGADNAFRREAAGVIVSQLLSAGINVQLAELDWAAYDAAIKNGSYDLYLGEIRLTNNMDLSPLLAQGGAASYGVDTAGAVPSAYTQLRAGAVSLADFVTAFEAAPPFLPLCYRSGIVAFTRSLTGEIKPLPDDIYANIAQWKF